MLKSPILKQFYVNFRFFLFDFIFRLVERGKIKCHNYWPQDGETQFWGPFVVKDTDETIIEPHFRRQKLLLEFGSQTREIFHFQFTQVDIRPDRSIGATEFLQKYFVYLFFFL